MAVKVGIPRALLYYHYFPMWKSFFQALGVEVVASGPSTKSVLNKGVRMCVEDACLPVKLAIGHVAELADRVDYLFLPRLVSVAAREYICPKFLGFPDMVRQTFRDLPGIIDVNVNLYRRESGLYSCFREAGSYFASSIPRIYLAYKKGLGALKTYRELLDKGYLPEEAMRRQEKDNLSFFRRKNEREGLGDSPGMSPLTGTIEEKPTVAIIGHPYNIYDCYINMNILKRLAHAGVKVITADQAPKGVIRNQAACLPKPLFWTLSQQMIGAAFYFLQGNRAHGLLHITSFGCGPDSMTEELIEKKARQAGTVPLLSLVLDEHTGEAGVLTRLEAFLDMVESRIPKPKKLRA